MEGSAPRTIIHFVRHGEVDDPHHVRYGRLPGYHLSTKGRSQVEAAAEFLAKRPLVHIYTSPLERTQQSALIIASHFENIPISLDDRITEQKTAQKYEGKSRDLGFAYPDTPTNDAETIDEIVNRFQQFTESSIVIHKGQEIVAVTHGDPIALFYTKLVYTTPSLELGQHPENGSVSSIAFNGLVPAYAWYHSWDMSKRASV